MKTIREILTGRPPVTIEREATVLEAALRMRDAKVGAILVVDGSGALSGVFTERDMMLRVIVEGLPVDGTEVQAVMTRDLFTVDPDQRINEAARELQRRHIRHLPILEEGAVIEMLSLRDLLAAHLEIKRGEVQALTSYIQGVEGASQ